MKLFNEILQAVTVDCKDNGENFICSKRVDVIKKLLEKSEYSLLREGDLTLIYGKRHPSIGDAIILISSHIDCLYSDCFCTDKGEMWHGTFDNSFTNAAVLWNMLNGKLPDNVIIAFTGDEEKNSQGAIETIAHIAEMNCSISYALVLDVTNVGWSENASFTIENDYGFDIFTAHKLVELLQPYKNDLVFQHDSEPDESMTYYEMFGLYSFTLCVPACGDMHSDEGIYIRKASFPAFCDVMTAVVGNLIK